MYITRVHHPENGQFVTRLRAHDDELVAISEIPSGFGGRTSVDCPEPYNTGYIFAYLLTRGITCVQTDQLRELP